MFTYALFMDRIRLVMAVVGTLTLKKIINITHCFLAMLFKRGKSGNAPVILEVRLTHRCNYACIICAKSSIDKNAYTDNPKDIDFPTLERLLRDIAPYTSLVRLSGGEPAFNNNFLEIIDLLDELDLKFTLLTNGSLLSPQICKRLVNNCVGITFSIDSVNKEKYAEIRRNGSLDRIVQNIACLNTLKIKHRAQTPCLNMAAALFTFNIDELPDMVEFCRTHGIASLSVSEGCFYNTPYVQEEQLLACNRHLIKPAIDPFLKKAKKAGIKVRLNASSFRTGASNDMAKKKPVIKTCKNFYLHAIVNPNLDVFACCVADALGNLKNNSFDEIWNGAQGGFLFNRVVARNGKLPQSCRYCKAYNSAQKMKNQFFSYTNYQIAQKKKKNSYIRITGTRDNVLKKK